MGTERVEESENWNYFDERRGRENEKKWERKWERIRERDIQWENEREKGKEREEVRARLILEEREIIK